MGVVYHCSMLVKVKVDLCPVRRYNYVISFSSIASVRSCDQRAPTIAKDGAHESECPATTYIMPCEEWDICLVSLFWVELDVSHYKSLLYHFSRVSWAMRYRFKGKLAGQIWMLIALSGWSMITIHAFWHLDLKHLCSYSKFAWCKWTLILQWYCCAYCFFLHSNNMLTEVTCLVVFLLVPTHAGKITSTKDHGSK